MGCHGEKSVAKYFDMTNTEKKTISILADRGGKKNLEASRKSGREPGMTSENSCKMFFLEDQRSMLEKCWNGPGSL